MSIGQWKESGICKECRRKNYYKTAMKKEGEKDA